jgi:putative addiction module CopG family antidote
MNIDLTPEQRKIVKEEPKTGRFHTVEEVIAEALQALRERERSAIIVPDLSLPCWSLTL